MHERIRDALLQRWGFAVTRHPKLTLSVCLLLAVFSVVMTARYLEFRPDRSDLIDRHLDWNRRYAEYKANFPRWDSLLICLAGDPADPSIDELSRALALQLEADERVTTADAGFLESQADPRLFVLAPQEEFESILGRLRMGRQLAHAAHANQALTLALGNLARAEAGPDTLDELPRLLGPYLAAVKGEEPIFDVLNHDEPQWRSLASTTGRLRFIQVEFATNGQGIDSTSANLNWLREQVRNFIEPRAPTLAEGLEWGVTGIPAIEADETVQSIHDSTVSSIVAFIAITCLMLIVFRGITVPLLAAGSLLIGMAWSFGWLIATIGHLQLLSVVFSVILLGLGIDFALHLVARLELVQDEHQDLPSAIARVYRGIGPGMITGAVTTAAAFLTTAFTDFKGMAEMGIIAGGGILLCLIAMLSAFPAALALTGRWKRIIRHRPGGEEAHFAHGRLDIVDRKPWPTLILAIIVVGLMILAASKVRYDPNVLNLHPPDIESVQWEKRLVEDDARSVWGALIRTTPTQAATLTRRLRELPTVSEVSGMGILFPEELESRQRQVQALREEATPESSGNSDVLTLLAQLATVRQGLAQRIDGETETIAMALRDIVADIDVALLASRQFSDAENEAHYEALNESFVNNQAPLRAQIERALSEESIDAADLPEFLQTQWVGESGTWLLCVFPTGDAEGRSILHPQRLGEFVTSIRRIDPNVFGPPVQIYESSLLIKRSYILAALYAVAAILILLVLDFRSVADSVCSMIPVSIGFIGIFGMMGLTGLELNFANIIVMPMIFGIGVDAGVHMVHRWRVEPQGRPAGLSGATGRGISLTMTTTMIGFGSMMLAEHRGIRSLGIAMLTGLFVTLLACYVVLPPLLRLRTPDSHDIR